MKFVNDGTRYKKSTSNPKRVTLSDTAGKRASYSLKWKKLGESTCFLVINFSVFKHITKKKLSCRSIYYSTLKSRYSKALQKISVMEV